ncbi:hypothetical protein G3N99_30355 [Burkholderia sp. Ac-20392]|nr:hypothetical protein [Burkholderia sp. Ac-20392]
MRAAHNPRCTAAGEAEVVGNCAPAAFIGGRGYTDYTPDSPGFSSVERFVSIGGAVAGYLDYETLVAKGSDTPSDYQPAP